MYDCLASLMGHDSRVLAYCLIVVLYHFVYLVVLGKKRTRTQIFTKFRGSSYFVIAESPNRRIDSCSKRDLSLRSKLSHTKFAKALLQYNSSLWSMRTITDKN
jgi:hypothetical protein